MEEDKKQTKSIWGEWWEPIRKWFYPTWLLYETTIRFYDYAQAVHHYFIKQQEYLSSFIGEIATQTIALFMGVATFAVCFAFLTVPTCFILYEFFKTRNLTGIPLEGKIKYLL